MFRYPQALGLASIFLGVMAFSGLPTLALLTMSGGLRRDWLSREPRTENRRPSSSSRKRRKKPRRGRSPSRKTTFPSIRSNWNSASA